MMVTATLMKNLGPSTPKKKTQERPKEVKEAQIKHKEEQEP